MLYGTRVKELCKKYKISVAELERKAGIPPKSISGWDKSVPSGDKIYDVVEALDISFEEFYDLGSPNFQATETAMARLKRTNPGYYEHLVKEKTAAKSDGDKDDLSDYAHMLFNQLPITARIELVNAMQAQLQNLSVQDDSPESR